MTPLKPTAIATARPCANCPFRRDVWPFLRAARVREIYEAAKQRGEHFVCHKTVDYAVVDGLDLGRLACAGFLILARRSGLFPGLQIVQLAKRLAGVNFRSLKGGEVVYRSFGAMIDRHQRSE